MGASISTYNQVQEQDNQEQNQVFFYYIENGFYENWQYFKDY